MTSCASSAADAAGKCCTEKTSEASPANEHALPPSCPPASVEDTQQYIAAEAKKWGDLVRKLGLAGSQ
jgi:hypothetical protein